MIAVSRPLLAAACLLLALMPGLTVRAQAQFLDPNIIQATVIDAPMRQAIDQFVTPQLAKLKDAEPDVKAVAEARTALLRVLDDVNASPAFLDAISAMIAGQMNAAVIHKNDLVRLNAMIVISRLTDEDPNGSPALIKSGLGDKHPAVQRWAMEALYRRTMRAIAEGENAQINELFKQIVAKLQEQPAPHPIVIMPGVKSLLAINTADARQVLIKLLDDRLALHQNDPDLACAPEQLIFQTLGATLVIDQSFDLKTATSVAKNAFRYGQVILNHLQANDPSDVAVNAPDMLYQCTLTLAQLAGGAGVGAPQGQAGAANAISNERWGNVQTLLNDWATQLKAAPFNLTDEELGL